MAITIAVIDKATSRQSTTTASSITLSRRSIVELSVSHSQVKTLVRQGNDLAIVLADDQTILIENYFVEQVF
jgi:hypothetical protein